MSTGQSAGRGHSEGRTRLLDTAEELLDRHGIDGVSIRTVTKASGHRNSSAVNYHFGTREQLIAAVLERRQVTIEARRAALLDHLEAEGDLSPATAVRVAMLPLVELLDDAAGRRYIRLLHQAANHPDYYQRTATEYSASISRTAKWVTPLVAHLPAERQFGRLRLGILLALTALADQARTIDRLDGDGYVLDAQCFADDLLAVTVAALKA
ncbi:MAG TPA: helix-turn-helix domain-containing protein [Ilumatobacteraceae bacterium]|nr:helix-turn-helix domain-containing protein [Ilumatobacteraceae bacterium]